ncbi:MAG: hypothetical protein MUE85_18760 [Microscillaceae bacterium]|jgi:hypothetical protein|nr:hypothetical protein [Microscillaceae bacterium]
MKLFKRIKVKKNPKVVLNDELLQKISQALKEKPIGQDKLASAKKLFEKGMPDWDKLT